jgi:hypothetical protein
MERCELPTGRCSSAATCVGLLCWMLTKGSHATECCSANVLIDACTCSRYARRFVRFCSSVHGAKKLIVIHRERSYFRRWKVRRHAN